MTKFIMIGQLMFFFVMGTHIVNHQLTCARDDGIASVYIEMPLKALSEVEI